MPEEVQPSERTINLGRGQRVPYPTPSSEAATAIGKANRRVDSKAELLLRSALHRAGHRFRKDHRVRVGEVTVRPDIVFTRARVAIFVDGCFWHSCPQHGRVPQTNRDYWVPKLDANRARDKLVTRALRTDGWSVVRVWEHESAIAALGGIEAALEEARAAEVRQQRRD